MLLSKDAESAVRARLQSLAAAREAGYNTGLTGGVFVTPQNGDASLKQSYSNGYDAGTAERKRIMRNAKRRAARRASVAERTTAWERRTEAR